MNLVPSPMCTFCGDHEETLEHLLISCTYTKNFWLSVISWLNTYNMNTFSSPKCCERRIP